ncbi:hypothetical protein JCM19274_1724 [Algibacter lectus]|uniref:DUF4294 domain-containing protein n=1 Tax=Algibacter lectus TaxID=221126 RepID=A0A090X6L6_9FLAO|nr:DUF4294 domain-containing protein [Algibacter lectus]GAL81497.1 hypothetical protein JCM19274_1724 [Algibacter lectus]SFD56159.1 protein of unknown function [Algibacter lectus]
MLLIAQVSDVEQDTTVGKYLIIKGDSIPRTTIDLDAVMILPRLKFENREARIRYLILRRKTLKVYPYAKMAADRLDSLTKHLATLTKNREKKKYTRKIQKYIEGEFSDELKKMSRTEGQILVKLIHRQTGITTFELVKELRNGWRAFWYNTTASMFDISLKREFDPENEKEDYLIEDILQRNFQSGRLVRQKSAIPFDFYTLTEKWRNTPEKP